MERIGYIGLKLTPQRMAIFDYLEGNKDHPSAEQIYRAVASRFPSISLATVYNTLKTLKERGSVKELTIDPAKKRYDPVTVRHHHLMCIACKKIVDVQVDRDLTLPKTLSRAFTIIGSHVDLYGICSGCRKNNKQHPTKEDFAHVSGA